MKKKLTVKDLRDFKGNKKLVSILAKNVDEAKAAHKVGFELLATGSPGLYRNPDNHPNFEEIIKIRDACPYAFMHWGVADTLYSGFNEATKVAFKALEHGIDMFYCHNNFDLIKGLYKQGIPGLGHVGLVPSRRTWTGGFKAVGKNSTEAMLIYEECLMIQDAGGVAIEMECVPFKIAEAITKKVEPTVVSMGSGPGCDAEFLFGCDILGTTAESIPRHAKMYRNFNEEHKRLQRERENAFQEFYNDVKSGSFPEQKHIISIEENELDKFLNELEKR